MTEAGLPKRETTSKEDMYKLIQSLDLTANTKEQTECMLNGNNDPKYKYLVKNLAECMPAMAPGYLTGNATVEERTLSAKGLMPNLINGTRYSMCAEGMPCKEYNNFLLNGTLLELSYECGTFSNLLKIFTLP